MSWKLEVLKGDLGHQSAAWDDLNRKLCASHPLLDARFVNRLLRHFGTGREVLCVTSAGGAAPDGMMILTPAKFWRWQTFQPSQAQIGPVLLSDARSLRGLLRKLPRICLAIDILSQDPVYSAVLETSSQLPALQQEHALTINIAVTPDFGKYWDERPLKLRQNIRRYRRRAEEAGLASRLAVTEDPQAITAAVNRYAQLESRGWKSLEGTALSPDNEQGRFYSGVMEAFSSNSSAVAYELYLGPNLAASRLAIRNDDILVALKTTYDENFAQFAPGRLLLHDFVVHEFERQRVRSIEFYTSATADQLAWCTSSRRISHASIFRNRLGLGGYLIARKGISALRRK